MNRRQVMTSPSEPHHPHLIDRLESGLEHLGHKGEPVTEPATPLEGGVLGAEPAQPAPQVFQPAAQAAETIPLQEVVSFHGPNSFYELNADRIEITHDQVGHPMIFSAPPVTVLTLTAHTAGQEPALIQLDQPTAIRLADAIKAGFVS